MTLDIRYPIGWLFGLIGGLLVAQGLWGGSVPAADRNPLVGLNVDLWWGGVMLAFGAAMLFFARRGRVR